MIISCRDHFHYITHCLLQKSGLNVGSSRVSSTRLRAQVRRLTAFIHCSSCWSSAVQGFSLQRFYQIRFRSLPFDLEAVQKGQQYLILYYCEMIRLAWFTGLLWRSGLSPPYLTAIYFMALSHGIQAVDLQDHLLFKNLNPKHPINPFLIDLWQFKIG